MSWLVSRQSLGVASIILGMSVLLSRVMGLVRDKVISVYYGASVESDIYFAAFVIPDFINYLLAGGYFAITLIPLLSQYFQDDEAEGWRFFSAVLSWIVLVSVGLTLLAMILAPWLAKAAAPGFDGPALARLARFIRIILPAQVFFLAGSCFTSLLYLRRQFKVPALTPLFYNGMIIGVGLLFLDKGMEGFCWGVLAGSLVGNFLLPLAAALGGGLRFHLRLRHSGLRKFLFLALPLMIGQSVVVLDEQFLRIFGSLSVEGAVSRLNYARRIMLVPVGVIAQAAGVASYPFLAGLAASADWERFTATLRQALTGVLAFLTPASVWMIAAAAPTVTLIFRQGRFGPQDAFLTTGLLRIMLLGVFCWGVQQMIGRAFYARKDTLTPSLVGTLATLAALPVYWLLVQIWGEMGIAVGSVFSIALYTAALSLVWRLRHGGEVFSRFGALLLKLFSLSAVSAIAAWPLAWLPQRIWPQAVYLPAMVGLLASGLVFCALYALLGWRLAPELVQPIINSLRRKGTS